MTKKTVIVVPGLGDEAAVSKIRAITKRWGNNYDVRFFDSRWESDESLQDKQKRLRDFAKLHTGKNTSVVAYSAGGALAITLLNVGIKINKLVLISCKLKRPEGIGPKYQKRALALVDAVEISQQTIGKLTQDDKDKIVCMKPLFDGVVDRQDMVIEETENRIIPFVGHGASIGFAMLFQVKSIISAFNKYNILD